MGTAQTARIQLTDASRELYRATGDPLLASRDPDLARSGFDPALVARAPGDAPLLVAPADMFAPDITDPEASPAA